MRFAVTEANILKESNHPFVLKMYYSFQTPQNLYLVTDFCAGKDLSFIIAQKVMLEEKDAKFYIAEIILALIYLHKNNILYRDMKPENVLIDIDGHIKLADFGLSKENVGDNDLTQTFCGSPACIIFIFKICHLKLSRKKELIKLLIFMELVVFYMNC